MYLKAEVYYQQSEELHSYWLYCRSSFATWWAGIKNAWISVCEQRPSIIIEEDISKFVTDHIVACKGWADFNLDYLDFPLLCLP